MKRPKRKFESFGQKLRRRVGIPALIFLALLLGARLVLPYVVRDYVNRALGELEGFQGHVDKIRMSLYRGAYTILNLQLFKTGGQVPVPFLSLSEMDLSLDWSELFRGSLVGRVTVNRPQVNFVAGPTEQQKQAGFHKNWKQTLESITPFTINRFQVNNGSLRFLDPYRQPKVDLYVTNLFATATNLTNVRKQNVRLPAGLVARGKTIGGGDLHLELHMNPLAHAPTFSLVTSLTNVNMTALNDFLRAYAGFDVEKGTFALFVNVAAADQKYQGYAKPFFFDLQVFSWPKEEHKNLWQIIWEAIVAGISELFRNQPYNQVATQIPISGAFEKGTQIDLLATIVGILQNAFVEALSPRIVRSVPLPDTHQNRGEPRGVGG